MTSFRSLLSVSIISLGLATGTAHAFVAAPVGGHPGELDLTVRVSFERGKVEPNEYDGSFQHARWNVYHLGVGYTYGSIGPLKDVFFRLDGSLYDSPAETSDPDHLVNPSRGAPALCAATTTPDGHCEFHPDDVGALLTPSIGANLLHVPELSVGVFLQGTIPIGVDLDRLTLPRVDYVGGGVQIGARITPWLGYTSRTYVGSGAPGRQNATIALTNLFVFEAREWLLPWKIGVGLGPYFEGDLTERFDDRYDAAYTASYPDRRDRIRSMKLGIAVLPYIGITDQAALELGYVQKLFGYDAPATQLYYVGLRGAL